MKAFIEAHYYDNGFISESLPRVNRLGGLPTPDKVGPKSSEIELAPGDYAFEISRWSQPDSDVLWIGCFTHTTDRTHGDRGNYCGAGIWLIDCVPINISHFLNFLKSLTDNIARGGGPAESDQIRTARFLVELPSLGWTTESNRVLVTPRIDLASGSSRRSSYIDVGPLQESAIGQISSSMLCFLFQEKDDSVRQLYFAQRNSKVNAPTVTADRDTALVEKFEDILGAYITASADAVNNVNVMRKSYELANGTAKAETRKFHEIAVKAASEFDRLKKTYELNLAELTTLKAGFSALNIYSPQFASLISELSGNNSVRNRTPVAGVVIAHENRLSIQGESSRTVAAPNTGVTQTKSTTQQLSKRTTRENNGGFLFWITVVTAGLIIGIVLTGAAIWIDRHYVNPPLAPVAPSSTTIDHGPTNSTDPSGLLEPSPDVLQPSVDSSLEGPPTNANIHSEPSSKH